MAKDPTTGLTPKQERFCQEYVIDHNGTQAAIRAGYSEDTAGSQAYDLLQKPEISARVKELDQTAAEKLGLTAEWVLSNLKTVVEKANQAVEVQKFDPTTRQMVGTGEYVFDSKGANRALELIGKHLGILTDKVDHTTGGKPLPVLPVITVVDGKTADLAKRLAGE